MARTLAVIVPGFMGSTLVHRPSGESLWAGGAGAFAKCVARLGRLKFHKDHLGDVEAPTLLDPIKLIWTFFHGYGALRTKLEALDAEPQHDITIREWPYDWRRGLRDLGDALWKDIQAFDAEQRKPYDRVLLIAHSFGCVVAREALRLDLGAGGTIAARRTSVIEIAPALVGSASAVLAAYRSSDDLMRMLGSMRLALKLFTGGFAPDGRRFLASAWSEVQKIAVTWQSLFELWPPDTRNVVYHQDAGRYYTSTEAMDMLDYLRVAMLEDVLAGRDAVLASLPAVSAVLGRAERVVLALDGSTPHVVDAENRGFDTERLTRIRVMVEGDGKIPQHPIAALGDARLTIVTNPKMTHNSLFRAQEVMDLIEDVLS